MGPMTPGKMKPWVCQGIITNHYIANLTPELTSNDDQKFMKQRRAFLVGKKKRYEQRQKAPKLFQAVVKADYKCNIRVQDSVEEDGGCAG